MVVKKKKPVKKITLSPEEKHWDQAEKRSKEIIDQLFNRNLPLEFRPQDLDLEKSTDWRMTARDSYDGVPSLYQDEDQELPETEYLAEEIAYHYLLTVLKRFTDDLSEYTCHDSVYFEQLTRNESY